MNFASSFGPKKALTLAALLALPALAFASGCAGDDTTDPATGGTGGTGSGGMGTGGSSGSAAKPLPTIAGCDIPTILSNSCAAASCHRAKDTQGSLDLTVDDGLRARIYNVGAPHTTIDCDPDLVKFLECVPPPAACPSGDKYIDPVVPANSWLIKKLEPQTGCGDQMPMPPGNSASKGWGDPAKQCLIQFFNALAAGQ